MNTIFEFEKPDIVIHGAAENFVDSSTSNPTNFINTNVLGTQVIIDCCVKWGVEKIIYMSTYEVYGHLTSESDPLWKEDATLNPRNPYSATKAAGEMLVKAAHESFGLNYNIIRSSNNYGPRQTSEKLIPKVIKCILNNEKIPIYGQGLQIRDWTHVFDNCNGILSVLNNGKINETYNISANQEFTNIEVVQKICNTMNKGHDLISYVPDRPGHDFRYGTDSSKIRELGWKQQFKFKDGIKDSIEWFNSNSWFLNH
jgi:dTDP-glucose 4,6-dehydratase